MEGRWGTRALSGSTTKKHFFWSSPMCSHWSSLAEGGDKEGTKTTEKSKNTIFCWGVKKRGGQKAKVSR